MISVIIPMYNEEKGCENCIEKLDSFLKSTFDEYEIVAVNDGSTDKTNKVLSRLCDSYRSLKACSYPKNRGKGGAVRYGIMNARYDTLLYTDCDLAYGTKIIKEMYDKLISSKTDIIIGSRNLSSESYSGYTPLRRFASKLYLKIISHAAGFEHSDSQCGIKCFGGGCAQRIFSQCEINGFAFDLEALMIAKKEGYSVSEYPVTIINHNETDSKVRIFRDTVTMLSDVGKIKRRLNRKHKNR